MTIAKRLIRGVALPMLAWGLSATPSLAADVLQCVPYARAVSGIRIHGDAWTWWSQAEGQYQRGTAPRPGAVLSLANTYVMPLGHVAVVSRVVDERRILLRHANWSGPGVIDRDVLAVDMSEANDWSQVRIWWSPGQQMGARINPANGFIYPRAVSELAVVDPDDTRQPGFEQAPRMRVASASARFAPSIMPAGYAPDFERPGSMRTGMATSATPRLNVDPALFHPARDSFVGAGMQGGGERTLAMIVREVRDIARLP